MYRASVAREALRQSEIVSNVIEYRPIVVSDSPDSEVTFNIVTHPFAIVISQDCDLDWDHKARQLNVGGQSGEPQSTQADSKLLNSVLFCEAYKAEDLRSQPGLNSTIWKRVSQNKDERYHFMQSIFPECDADGNGIPELTLDFKKYFAINASTLYHQLISGVSTRRTVLEAPYAQHLSQRFSSYLARVALPADYESEPRA